MNIQEKFRLAEEKVHKFTDKIDSVSQENRKFRSRENTMVQRTALAEDDSRAAKKLKAQVESLEQKNQAFRKKLEKIVNLLEGSGI